MVYTTNCWLCGKPWNFHDDDTENPPFCDTCQGVWTKTLLIEDIMARRFKLPGTEEDDDDE